MAIHTPQGTHEFEEAVKCLYNRGSISCRETELLVNECCRNCTCRDSFEICNTECQIYMIGQNNDDYTSKVKGGMYTSGIYKGKNGYCYAHYSGGG